MRVVTCFPERKFKLNKQGRLPKPTGPGWEGAGPEDLLGVGGGGGGGGGEGGRYIRGGGGGEEGRGYEESKSTRTPALGEAHPVSPEMIHFCWGNCLGTLHRMSTCNLECWSTL